MRLHMRAKKTRLGRPSLTVRGEQLTDETLEQEQASLYVGNKHLVSIVPRNRYNSLQENFWEDWP